ncbi:hypothetical protein Tco_0169865 [Tanacetum coccineum]
MTTLNFDDLHNIVAFLTKSAKSKGFEQIVDFLNASSIRYALTVNPTIYTLCIKQFWATVKVKTVNGEVPLQALVDGKKIIITKATIRRDLQLEDAKGIDCLSNATIFEQLSFISAKTTAWNEFSSTMASAIICLATNQKFNFSKYIFESMVKNLDNAGKFLMYPSVPNDPTNVADEAVNEEPSMQLNELMDFCTKLQQRGRHDDDLMFDTRVLNDEEVFAGQDTTEKGVSTADLVTTAGEVVTAVNVAVSTISTILVSAAATITKDEITLAQALAELKSVKPKVTTATTIATKGILLHEPSKAKMIELEKPLKKKDHIKFDEEEALRLQAAFDEEDRLAKEKAQQVEEANIAWDDIQAKIDVDYQLAKRLQAQEQQELIIEERSTLFQQLLEKRRKFFAAKRAEEKRNRPPTRA